MRRLKNILVNVIYTIFYAVSLNYNSSFSLHSPFVTNHRSKNKIVFFFNPLCDKGKIIYIF